MENQSFIENIRKASDVKSSVKERVLLEIKQDIKRMADLGHRYCVQYPSSFKRIVANAIDKSDRGDESRVDFETYHEMLNFMVASLKEEGFKVSASFTSYDGRHTGLYFNIEW